jgi:antitoxin MazE
MLTIIRQIGNSRGVILPAKLLAEAGIGERVDIRIDAGKLVIEPIAAPRQGWFAAALPEIPEDDAWDTMSDTDREQEDWEW